MKSIQFRRNLTIILSTLFIVALIYILYIQVYTRAREEKLIQTRFRVLDQMGENLKAKMESYQKNAKTWKNEVFEANNQLKNSIKERDALASEIEKLNQVIDLNVTLEQVPKNQQYNQTSTQNTFKLDKELLKENQQYLNFRRTALKKKEELIKEEVKNSMKSFASVYNNELIFVRSGSKEIGNIIVRNDSILILSDSMEFYISGEFLLRNIDRRDVFPQTLVIAHSAIIYSSLKEDLKLARIEEFENNKNGREFSLFSNNSSDTLLLPAEGKLLGATIHGNRCFDIQLSDGMYKLFLKPVKIDRLDWFIGGLIKSSEFQREKQSIAPWFLIVITIVLMVTLLSIPFIKLKVISKTEMLGPDMIIKAAFSLLLGTSLIILFLFFQANNISHRNDIDSNIENFSLNIHDTIIKELISISDQLDSYDRKLKELVESMPASGIESKLKQLRLNEVGILDSSSTWNPVNYKYFDYVFWMDEEGMQSAQVSPFERPEKLQNFAFRDYFKNHNQWPWTLAGKDSSKFMIESIVSAKSGDYKAAFSRKSSIDNSVIVMTGRFHSIFDPILPKNYKFCIIDGTGEVWFHSNKYQNKSENFIKECGENRILKAAVYAKVPKLMDVHYYNDPYRIFIRPMDGLPLYLVTMHDDNTTRTYQFQVFITTILLISGLFVFIFSGAFLFILFKRIFESDKRWSFLVEYTRPRQHHRSNYLKMCIILCLWFIPFIFIWFMNNAAATLSILVLVCFLIISLILQIYKLQTRDKRLIIYIGVLGVITLTIMILSFLIKGDAWLFLGISYLLIIALFGMIISGSGSRILTRITERITDRFPGLSYVHAYTIFLFLMIMLLGAAPTIKFFHIAVELENKINIRHNQYELYKATENRNEDYRKYYSRIQDPPVGIPEQKARQKKGIYTSFWRSTYPLTFATADSAGWNPPSYSASLSALPDSIINKFRPIFDDLSVENKFILFDDAQVRNFYWEESRDPVIFKYKTWTEDGKGIRPSYGKITTSNPIAPVLFPFHSSHHFRYPFVFNTLFFIILLIPLLVILWLIFFSIRRIFVASLTEEFEILDFKSRVRQQLMSNKRLMLVRLSGVSGFDHLVDDFKKEFNIRAFQFTPPIPKAETKEAPAPESNSADNRQNAPHPIKPGIWLIHELDSNYFDPPDFLRKINEIKTSISSRDYMVILMQNNPDTIQKYYEDKLSLFAGKDKKEGIQDDEKKAQYSSSAFLFNVLLREMVILQVPVKSETALVMKETVEDEDTGKSIQKQFDDLIDEELDVSDYLIQLKDSIKNYLRHLTPQNLRPIQVKKLILTHITELAGKYYQDLFNSCTPDEKFVLFDLSHDMIVNDRNRDSMRALWIKGLLVRRNNMIMIMNRSFCEYIRQIHTLEEKQTVKKAMGGEAGRWKGYRIALIMIVVALLVFLFISNQNFLTNINKLIMAVVASLTGITTIFNMTFRKNKE